MSGHVLVTGASSGIGAAIAEAMLAAGWTVTAASRRPPPFAGTQFVETDLGDDDGIRALAAACRARGPVTALVHAAGLLRPAPLGALDHAGADEMWRTHVRAPSLLLDELVGDLVDGARVVLVGSRTATGQPGKSAYAASKAALVGLSRSWASELAPRGITVNVVAPGPTDTPLLRDPARAGLPATVPALGRFVAPEEVAGLVAFLLGPWGGSITGQHLVMCGGASLP